MDAIIEKLVESLLSQGLAGVIILGMGLWIWKLQQQLSAVQEKRVEDATKIVESIHDFANALDRNTEMLRMLKE